MAATDRDSVLGGLADPTLQSQSIFRALMQAFAEPGTIADFSPLVAPPGAIEPAAASILAALADADTPIWLEEPDAAAAGWLQFQTGAPITDDRAAASFAVLSRASEVSRWAELPAGTPDYPDRSATVILPVEALHDGPPLTLSGPGIETTRVLAATGLPDGFTEALAANRRRFPLGFDLVLVAGTRALALTRTTRIREG
jgi:alpha-D-ribose 1-methylphosphonate 5-triphosphate synthase subunit PhnH